MRLRRSRAIGNEILIPPPRGESTRRQGTLIRWKPGVPQLQGKSPPSYPLQVVMQDWGQTPVSRQLSAPNKLQVGRAQCSHPHPPLLPHRWHRGKAPAVLGTPETLSRAGPVAERQLCSSALTGYHLTTFLGEQGWVGVGGVGGKF